MFAVIFEVQPKQDRVDQYLALAKRLKPLLEAIDGFIDNERFASTRSEGRILSLSTWRDEKALVRWRTQREHHHVQEQGRFKVFEDYHLRIGEITADTHPPASMALDEKRFDETAVGAAKVCTITEVTSAETNSMALQSAALPARLGLYTGAAGLIDHEVFASITNADKLLLLASWANASAARAWSAQLFEGVASLRHRHVRIIRDYGMHERREAPQYYPEVESSGNGERPP